MDSFTEKKWFVYISDHHEGPHTLEEIQGKLALGAVSIQTYVWCDGMPDWKPMSEVSDFRSLIQGLDPSPTPPPPPVHEEPHLSTPQEAPQNAAEEPRPEESAATLQNEELIQDKTIGFENSNANFSNETPNETPASSDSQNIAPVTDASKNLAEQRTQQTIRPSKASKPKKSISRAIFFLLAFLILFGVPLSLYQGYLSPVLEQPSVKAALKAFQDEIRPPLVSISEKIPFLGSFISPIPPLLDISREEFEDLKQAARKDSQSPHVKVSFALSQKDPSSPLFYVASNAPDGTLFKIYLLGIPDTLLSQMSFQTSLEATLSKHLSVTPVGFPDGKPVPRGEYQVYVGPPVFPAQDSKQNSSKESPLVIPESNITVPPELPRDLKPLVMKTYFLGGPRDEVYLSRLKEFHDRLRAKATEELSELNQFVGTLDSQLSQTTSTFDALKKGRAKPKQRKAWERFHSSWIKLQSQLEEMTQKWNLAAQQNQLFYSTVFQLVPQSVHAINKIHELQHSYFVGLPDLKTLAIQLGESTASALSTLSYLKAKIAQAEKTPPTPNGMPQREGL